ncbi:MAG: DUF58 domain-containing protein [Lachnospiraceae bacterium]|nr:DUF58 domain-containing protein [Lachnospiraceae bacterium]
MELLIALSAVLLLYVVRLRSYNFHWSDHLGVYFSFQHEAVTEGESAVLTETITNEKKLPLPMLHVMFLMSRNSRLVDYNGAFQSEDTVNNEIFSLKPYHQIVRRLRINCPKRGCYRIYDVSIESSNPFWDGRYKKELPQETSLFVYPAHTDLDKLLPIFHQMMEQYLTIRYSMEDPFLLRGIRDYQTTDPMRLINWKASAKGTGLQVNLYEHTSNAEIILLLDLSQTMEDSEAKTLLLEETIRITKSLASLFLDQGIPTGFATNAVSCLTLTPVLVEAGSGKSQDILINESLSSLLLLRSLSSMEDILTKAVEMEARNPVYVYISPSGMPLPDSLEELFALHPGSMVLLPYPAKETPPSFKSETAATYTLEVNVDESK